MGACRRHGRILFTAAGPARKPNVPPAALSRGSSPTAAAVAVRAAQSPRAPEPDDDVCMLPAAAELAGCQRRSKASVAPSPLATATAGAGAVVSTLSTSSDRVSTPPPPGGILGRLPDRGPVPPHSQNRWALGTLRIQRVPLNPEQYSVQVLRFARTNCRSCARVRSPARLRLESGRNEQPASRPIYAWGATCTSLPRRRRDERLLVAL